MKSLRNYAVYDITDNFLVVCVGDLQKVSEFIKSSPACILCAISRGTVVKKQYQIMKVEEV